jgi:serine protease Do
VARLDKIEDVARHFVLLRVGNMRGVNLDLFDFDYDLQWMAFFLSPNEKVLGRYGGRPSESPNKYWSLDGLHFALAAALAAHKAEPDAKGSPLPREPLRPELLPAVQKLPPNGCIHCHHVYEFRRDARQAAGQWKTDDVWVYPHPENVGLTLDLKQGNRVKSVAPNSAAAKLGVLAGDTLQSANGQPVASFADLQYALHRAPAQGTVPFRWKRQGKEFQAELPLAPGWRQTDITWRRSLRTLEPAPQLDGYDLTPEEKKALGLGPKQLAFRQGAFMPKAAQQAGVRINDVILGFDGKQLEMTFRQFDAHVRLNYRVGDEVMVNLIRTGKRLDLKLKL